MASHVYKSAPKGQTAPATKYTLVFEMLAEKNS